MMISVLLMCLTTIVAGGAGNNRVLLWELAR